MPALRVALYARVSSDQQTQQGTIASQVAALEARILQDGLPLEPDHRFIDEGHSGATLIRPALEHLRDAVAAEPLIGSTSIRRIGWPAAMPTRSY